MKISSITTALSPSSAIVVPAPSATGSFGEVIGAAINAVETAQASAKTATTDLLIGGKGDIHTVALESQRAGLTLELFQQVRNKFVQAYQEVMKMPM